RGGRIGAARLRHPSGCRPPSRPCAGRSRRRRLPQAAWRAPAGASRACLCQASRQDSGRLVEYAAAQVRGLRIPSGPPLCVQPHGTVSGQACPPLKRCAACSEGPQGRDSLDQKSRIVAIFNTNPEVLELVRESLQQAGFQAVIAHIDDLKRGRLDMIQFVEEHKPDVIVYDVAPPYDTNWTFLRLMRNSRVMQNRAFVVTTTNKRALEELIGPNDVVELLCKPYDLQQIVDACSAAFDKQVKVKSA